MAIKKLTDLVPPPAKPVDVPAKPDWKRVESEIGLSLPDDYKDFVVAYGTGRIGGFIRVCNPFDKDPFGNLVKRGKKILSNFAQLRDTEGEDYIPFDLHPESPGLLPWGTDDNGNFYFWLTEGSPNEWGCVVFAGRGDEWDSFDLPLTSFLAEGLRGHLDCEVWPEDFPDSDDCFTFDPFQ